MALQSQLFRGDVKLEAAAVSDPAHIVPGASGPHVGKIQRALVQLDGAGIAQDSSYGPATAAAVSAFKKKRQILNTQGQIDAIVGKKTIAALDREMLLKETGGGGGGSRGRLGFAVVGDTAGAGSPLVVIPFPGPISTPFVLAEEFDDPNSEDLSFADPPVPPQTAAQQAITTSMEAGELLTRPLISPVLKRESLMKAELGVSNGADGIALINFFIANGVPATSRTARLEFGPGTSLSNRVRDTKAFETEHEFARSDLDKALKRQFVNGLIDFRLLIGLPQRDTKFKVPNFLGNPAGVKEPPRVGFPVSEPTLLALIGDFQGCKLILKAFDVDTSKNTYRATLRYEFVEHFGLDNSDVNPFSSPGHGTLGQVAFWLLQHKSRPGHVPFRYFVIVEKDISGSLDPLLSDPRGNGPSR